MGALDMVLNEVESKFGLSGGNATTLLSSLMALINEQGGLGGFDSEWMSGSAKAGTTAERPYMRAAGF